MTDSDAIVTPQGATPGGLPYPEDTDAVMLGAQAIKALALAVDNQPPWPWWNFIRWTAGNVGTGADPLLQAWDLMEANFTTGDSTSGIVAPRAGLYLVSAFVEYGPSPWPASGQVLMSVGIKTSAVPPRELSEQRSEVTGGSNRRGYYIGGMLRAAAGESIRAFMGNGTGASMPHSSGVAPGDRHSSRFSGRWVAP